MLQCWQNASIGKQREKSLIEQSGRGEGVLFFHFEAFAFLLSSKKKEYEGAKHVTAFFSCTSCKEIKGSKYNSSGC
jgi:hypothetical protein